MKWKPIKTSEKLPRKNQEVFYWFEPFQKWFIGEFDGQSSFHSRFGFCNTSDAPYWHPKPPNPETVGERAKKVFDHWPDWKKKFTLTKYSKNEENK